MSAIDQDALGFIVALRVGHLASYTANLADALLPCQCVTMVRMWVLEGRFLIHASRPDTARPAHKLL